MTVAAPSIIQMRGDPANAYPDRRGYLLEGVVIHTAAGTLAGMDAWFANPAAQAGTHFGVGRNGEIHQYFPLSAGPFGHGAIEPGAAAAEVLKNGSTISPNWTHIGVEHDDLGKGALPTNAQFAASAGLVAWLFETVILPNAARTGADVSRRTILRHSEISPVSRPKCPGWPEPLLVRYVETVAGLLMPPPPPTPPLTTVTTVVTTVVKLTPDELRYGLIKRVVAGEWDALQRDIEALRSAT